MMKNRRPRWAVLIALTSAGLLSGCYYYPYGYYPPAPAYYPPAGYYPPATYYPALRSCWNPYYGSYYAC